MDIFFHVFFTRTRKRWWYICWARVFLVLHKKSTHTEKKTVIQPINMTLIPSAFVPVYSGSAVLKAEGGYKGKVALVGFRKQRWKKRKEGRKGGSCHRQQATLRMNTLCTPHPTRHPDVTPPGLNQSARFPSPTKNRVRPPPPPRFFP